MRKKSCIWKSSVAAGLAVSMLLTGCGSGAGSGSQAGGASSSQSSQAEKKEESSAQSSEAEKTKEPITFKIAAQKHTHCMTDDFNEKIAMKMAEEATGVRIEWNLVADGSVEKVNAMLTADLPDAFLGLVTEGQVANSMDSFLDIKDLLPQYAPHVTADYESLEGGLGMVTWPDGSIRSMVTADEVSYPDDADGIMIINKKWLDQLGLAIPTTTDEFYDVLCAFRDNDMNGNGDKTDEIPFLPSNSNWCAHVINMANAWGIAGSSSSDASHYFMVKNGKAVPTLDTPEYRAFLEYMHKLVAEGLMGKEAFTEGQNAEFFAMLKSGVVGASICWSPYAMMSNELAEQYVAVPYLNAPDGPGFVKTGRRNKFIGNKTGFAITSACKNPERLLEWWDYLSSSTEIKYIAKYGEKGGFWDFDANGGVYMKTPEGLRDDFTIENYKYTYGLVGLSPLIRKDEDISISKEQAFNVWFRVNEVQQVWDYMQTEYVPQRIVATEDLDVRTFIEVDLLKNLANFTSESILNGIDDAKWNAFLDNLKTWQYYEWIQWYQDYIDGKH